MGSVGGSNLVSRGLRFSVGNNSNFIGFNHYCEEAKKGNTPNFDVDADAAKNAAQVTPRPVEHHKNN
jgi:hypothetical protein